VYSIRRVGEYWEVCFDRERGLYRDKGNKGIRWLRPILAAPNRLLTVAEVRGDPEGKLTADARLRGEREIDAEAIRSIKRRLHEIEDIERETRGCEALVDEKAYLLRQLKRPLRRIATPLAKAHHTIATQIRTFRNKLSKDMPQLAAHLTQALNLNFPHFGYHPTKPTNWKIH
jgi:hypothetical protein